jgi:uncharacterized membrane protein YfcA
MLLILEIILTIVAWRKGWRWNSLIPVVSAMVIGFLFGIGIGLSGINVDDAKGFAIIIDILATVALIVMCIKKPKQIKSDVVSDETKN